MAVSVSGSTTLSSDLLSALDAWIVIGEGQCAPVKSHERSTELVRPNRESPGVGVPDID
jgi:hypothetical protein